MKQLRKTKRGFTLLEVLIALAIISGALITLIYTVNYHLSILDRHETITIGTLLGREKLLGITAQQRHKSGNFPPPYDDFAYEIEITDTPYEGIKLIKLSVIKDREMIFLSRFVRS